MNKIISCFLSYQQISYQSIESSDPGINVPGPRRTVSKLKNETYHMFSNLHPGTTYLISVRARTAKGFGQTALTEITTNISGSEIHNTIILFDNLQGTRKRFYLHILFVMLSDTLCSRVSPFWLPALLAIRHTNVKI